MRQRQTNGFQLLVVLLCGIVVSGCVSNKSAKSHSHSEAGSQQDPVQNTRYSNFENAVTKVTQDGLYEVTLFSNVNPIPQRVIHSWTVRIKSTTDQSLDNTKLYMFGGMPAHKHDFPTKPKVSAQSPDGKFIVDGIKFSMPGHWQIRLTILNNNQRDYVEFDVNL